MQASSRINTSNRRMKNCIKCGHLLKKHLGFCCLEDDCECGAIDYE